MDEDIHHIIRVMRMNSNDLVVGVFDKRKYLLKLNINNQNVLGEVVEELNNNNSSLNTTLIYGMPKNDKFELVLQKASELGISRIVPFLSERSVIKLDKKDIEKKLERWNKIVKEACEQCERLSLPIIESPIKIDELDKYKTEINLVCDENYGREKGLKLLDYLLENKNKNISFLVGPEGGFSSEEFDTFHQNGFVSVGLGKRILRSETAVISALSIIDAVNEEE